ncbi:cbb3-type cytochrome c oxidase subunit I [Mucilaginibacter psychrotolerans]|uniref:Cytochrome C oxidase subunit I n=1 Tax=Mucilaginibacter psychrotolerans TaxID=1524096 RepID=A0A4Y8SF95_9SPHI|nr:cbb3-type cytochrome c oxidase subunit I [Mucilaginibacter psychrotolerans]TFF37753.1 cytochrome C oxidase subunit I [Mucilaginibacter psychrotolerans]
MNISKPYRTVIITGLLMPMTLFILGAYNGVMQTIYRAGVIHKPAVAGISYYQGLTMHGVINAIVLTTFFAVVFGHFTTSHYLKREPPKWSYQISMILMVVGTLMDLASMLAGKAQALYTFYAPLQASAAFYIGTALLIVGSWFAFGGWIIIWFEWKKQNPGKKMPIAILGTFVNFSMWFISTLPVAYETLVILTPWSLGWTSSVNVPLTRMLFWMFGHPLVYFWLLPAYIAYYTVLPKVAGGKLYSGNAARLAFLLFLILSIPIGVHHQFSEPVFTPGTKIWVSILTYAVALPSFMTAFTVGASLEYAGKKRGAKGLLGWMRRLPYFEQDNFLFGYFICGLFLFIFGGISGIINASYTLNQMVHNTSWVPGHFHMTVAGPTILVILGMSLYMYSYVSGKEIKFKTFAVIIPYVWMVGVALLSHGLMAGGLMGEPRRTNMGLSYTNPDSPQFNKHWVPTTTLTLVGGMIMGSAAIIYFVVFFATAAGKRVNEPQISLPESEELYEEKDVPLLLNMQPWLVISIILIMFTYVPALLSVFKYGSPVKNKFQTENPQNLVK